MSHLLDRAISSVEAERTRSLVDAVIEYAIFALSPDGLVESWNSGAVRIKGYEAAEILGQHFSRFYTPEDLAAGKPEAALRAAAESGRFEDEAWRVRRDGSRFWAAVVIDAIRDADGTLTGFAKVTRDITARHELERIREQLQQAQKQELVGQLTSGLAHDFNNLLTAIIGSFDLIAKFNLDERVERFVEAGIVAASRGQRLVAQLLAFSRQQQLLSEPCDVNALISMLRELLASAVGERIEVRLRLDPDLPQVPIDQAHFQSALLNLIVNARDAMPGGGVLSLRTGLRVLGTAPEDAALQLAPGRYVMVEVGDTGSGMTEEVRRRAIEPFFTTKPVGAGSGLGLSQVYGFANQSGGALEIDSLPGQGARLRLLLPVIEHGAREDVPSAQRDRKAVLLVEDDAGVREVAREMLTAMGYEVLAASDAVEALAMLQHDTPIDLLFSDIVMPRGLSGTELARRAVALRPNLRVLLASAHPRNALQNQHGLSADVVFLQKPYRLRNLEKAMNGLLEAPDGSAAC